MDYTGKTVIITGGAASIGAAITRHFHALGANVVPVDLNCAKGVSLAMELGERALFLEADLREDDALDALIAGAVARFGGIDVLVNCAASYGDAGAETSRQMWLDTLNVSAVSAALLAERARPHLARSKGSIVNIGSVSGAFPHIGRWAYPVAKAALRHLSKAMAVDFADDGIRVNLLVLGHVWSDPFDGLTGGDRDHANTVTQPFNLMGRVAEATEIAQVAAFVASDAASYITGAEIPVDGGYSALGPEQRVPLMARLMRQTA